MAPLEHAQYSENKFGLEASDLTGIGKVCLMFPDRYPRVDLHLRYPWAPGPASDIH